MSEQNDRGAVFSYSYSAEEQTEIRRIREKYTPAEESKLDQLRRLDEGVARKGNVASICLGVVGSLVMGTGMSMCLVWPDTLIVPGVAVGVLGIVLVAAAYPVYIRITNKERERVAPQILRLTEELLK